MKHYEMTWKARDGLDIFAQSWEPTILQPKAVVCLVHGLGEHTSRYAHVAEAFGRQGFVLFGADLRGHGRSGGARGHISSIEDFMKDIDVLLEQARLRYPGLPIILYGHSLGGIQVLHYGLTPQAERQRRDRHQFGFAHCFGKTTAKSNDGKGAWLADAKYIHCQRTGSESNLTR